MFLIDEQRVVFHSADMELQITGGVVIIDDSDFDVVNRHSWYVNEHGYAISRVNGKLTRMHRMLLGVPAHLHVDHVNRNGMDNRRANLRIGGRSPNMWNSAKKNRGGKKVTSSRFKGVCFDKRQQSWTAAVWKFSKKIFTKNFSTEFDAALAYNIVAKREFGEYACLNDVSHSDEDVCRITAIVNQFKKRGPSKGGCVSYNSSWKRWVFTKIISGKRVLLGGFETRDEADAARALLHIA